MREIEGLNIREAGDGDVEALADLMTDLGYPSTPESMRRRFGRISSNPAYHTLVAEQGGRVIGMAGLETGVHYEMDGDYARISALIVASEYRGLGVGTALVREAELLARKLGAEHVSLNSGERRRDAHRFYQGSGYEVTGYRFSKRLGREDF